MLVCSAVFRVCFQEYDALNVLGPPTLAHLPSCRARPGLTCTGRTHANPSAAADHCALWECAQDECCRDNPQCSADTCLDGTSFLAETVR